VAVHITGAVANPGLYELPAGTRMAAALEVAGTLPDADLEAVNLAERLFDGQRVILPSRTRRPGPAPAPVPAEASGGKPPPGRTLIDINTAGTELLESLPGIGEARAAAILAWRQENGAFSSVDDLTLVSGIGPITLERVRPLVTVGRR
ncbi:helix-hairpin-helix domain-containing protein, partial [bacterium]|nr:helix-hairpin-helix domain-containing protein [bacterium]